MGAGEWGWRGVGNCPAQDNITILDHIEKHAMSIAIARRYDLQLQSLLGNKLGDMAVPYIEPLSAKQGDKLFSTLQDMSTARSKTNCVLSA